MRLDPDKFNRHLNAMGQSFGWRKGYACPCINPSSGQPRANCAQCSGKGRLWGDETRGDAGVVSQSRLRNFASFGPWDADDILLSIPSDSPLYEVGQFDRLMSLHRTEPFSMNLVRGLNDTLKFPVVSLERAFCLNDDQSIRELATPSISEAGVVTWIGGGAPPAQKTYSLTGRRRPEYFCYLELPTDRPVHHGAPLPRRVVLRRFDLFGR